MICKIIKPIQKVVLFEKSVVSQKINKNNCNNPDNNDYKCKDFSKCTNFVANKKLKNKKYSGNQFNNTKYNAKNSFYISGSNKVFDCCNSFIATTLKCPDSCYCENCSNCNLQKQTA